MDERYLLAAARYIELNPVRARMVARPEDYCWSSTRAHLSGRDDDLVAVAPLLRLVGNWKAFVSSGIAEEDMESIRRHERTGRPLGNDDFIVRIERAINRILGKQKPGPKGEKRSS